MSSFGISDEGWLTQVTIYKPSNKKELRNENMKANLFFYQKQILADKSVSSYEEAVSYRLLGEGCSQMGNNCTETVHGDRQFYISETTNQIDKLTVVLVNTQEVSDDNE